MTLKCNYKFGSCSFFSPHFYSNDDLILSANNKYAQELAEKEYVVVVIVIIVLFNIISHIIVHIYGQEEIDIIYIYIYHVCMVIKYGIQLYR